MGITIKDIAKITNCSLSTISRVINKSGYVSEETRIKVEKAIRDYNYVPSALAKHLTKGNNNIIGVVIPEIDNTFYSGIIKGINEYADSQGLSIILCDTGENAGKELRLISELRSQRIRGLLVTSAIKNTQNAMEISSMYDQLDMPVVLIDREIPGSNFDGIFFDDERAIFDLTSLLINNTHKHIEMLAGNPDLILGQNRARGYIKAFRSYGLEYKEEWIHYSLFTKEAGYEATMNILSRDRKDWPTALVTNNNMLTLGALKAIFEKKLSIPQDIALVGYDQIEVLEFLKINISLAEKDTIEMGRVAMKMLCEKISDKNNANPARRIIMMPKLMVRGSEKLIIK